MVAASFLLLPLPGCTPTVEPEGDMGGPVDADGDSYSSDVDCDDADPVTTERCDDTADHDCSGTVGRTTTLGGDVTDVEVVAACADGCPRSVTGTVTVDRSSRTDLSGFANLQSVDGRLELLSVQGLASLAQLANLTTVGSLWIGDTRALTSLGGLEGLTTVSGFVCVMDNGALTDVSGLANLWQVGDDVLLVNHEVLPSVDELRGLAWVGEDLEVRENRALPQGDAEARADAVPYVGGQRIVGGNGR